MFPGRRHELTIGRNRDGRDEAIEQGFLQPREQRSFEVHVTRIQATPNLAEIGCGRIEAQAALVGHFHAIGRREQAHSRECQNLRTPFGIRLHIQFPARTRA